MEKEYVTLNEAAAILEVTPSSLYNWRLKGELEITQPFGSRLNLVSRTELRRILKKRLHTVCDKLKNTPDGRKVIDEYLRQFTSSQRNLGAVHDG